MLSLSDFRKINSCFVTQYTVYKRDDSQAGQLGEELDFFTIDYLADGYSEESDVLSKQLMKAWKWENAGAVIKVFNTFNDVLRVTCLVD